MKRNFNDIEGKPFDLIIVGGGIIGASIARDAAMRGLKTLILEKDDFACGTTSRSTRLIHGGFRYLQHFEFGLVREDMREREILLHIAPHLVHPLPFLIPLTKPTDRFIMSSITLAQQHRRWNQTCSWTIYAAPTSIMIARSGLPSGFAWKILSPRWRTKPLR
jgi:glycerol-3-phosphate dehydrogenase